MAKRQGSLRPPLSLNDAPGLARALTPAPVVIPPRRRDFPEPIPETGAVLMSTGGAAHFHHIRDAISHDSVWSKSEETPFPVALISDSEAHGYVQLRPAALDEIRVIPGSELADFAAAMWQQVGEHSPRNGDAYDILAIKTIESRGKPFVIEIDEMLRMSGVRPKKGGSGRRGGFEPEQRQQMWRAVQSTFNAEITIDTNPYRGEGKQRRKTRERYVGRPWALVERREHVMLDGSEDVRIIHVAPGLAQGLYLLGPGRQVALLSAEIFALDPYRQAPESFLAKYLSWQWKAQAFRGQFGRPYRVETLLENCHLEHDSERPHRTRERLEKALNTLHERGITAGWHYATWKLGDAPARGWAGEWRQTTIIVDPPPAIREHYAQLRTTRVPTDLAAPPLSGLSSRLRETRERLKLSQAAAAEACDLPPQTYSRAERTGKASQENLHKIETWLAHIKSPAE
jgi:DNA-binding XRE family transcriptional regulator